MKFPNLLVSLGMLLPLIGSPSCTPTISLEVAACSRDQVLATCVFEQVNRLRMDMGSAPMLNHSGLNKLAAQHSEYMRRHRGTFEIHGKNVTHMGSEGRALVAMRIYNFVNSSENVAATMKCDSDVQSASKLVGLWRNSPDHMATMGASAYTHTGVGIVTDSDGTVFATQLFGTMSNSLLATRQRFNSF